MQRQFLVKVFATTPEDKAVAAQAGIDAEKYPIGNYNVVAVSKANAIVKVNTSGVTRNLGYKGPFRYSVGGK